jgi:phosphoglycerate dehydrogenase-like enzyme
MSASTPLLIVHHLHSKYWNLISQREPGLEVTAIENDNSIPFETSDAEILFCWRFQEGLLEKMPNLKWIAAASAGVDHITNALPADSEIIVTKSKATMGRFMAQYAIQHILNHINNYSTVLSQKSEKEWGFVKSDLLERYTIGILGLGSIGIDIAAMAKVFGMRVVAAKKTEAKTEQMEAVCDEIYCGGDWRKILPEADFLISLLPAHKDTNSMISTPEFKEMKTSSVFINIGRGSVTSETAVLHAIQTGLISGAVLDVFGMEPLKPNHPIWNEPRVIITPHCAGPSEVEHVGQEFLDNFKLYQAGKPLNGVVDISKGY